MALTADLVVEVEVDATAFMHGRRCIAVALAETMASELMVAI